MTLLPTGTNSNCELYCEADFLALADGSAVASFTDQSGKGRHLTAASSRPSFETAEINGKAIVRWNGSQNPLINAASVGIRCGWIVAKYAGATWASDFPGLFSAVSGYGGLIGSVTGETVLFDASLLADPAKCEVRANDRVYPSANCQGPMNAFKILFFRYWGETPIFSGLSLGQDRGFTARKWTGDVALLALYSRDFTEEEIRSYSKTLASAFGVSLADVYEYTADVDGHNETPEQPINFYDPPEGDRISEAFGDSKRIIDLKFSAANQTEVEYMKAFHASHYPSATPFLYRDYRVTPPRDIEVYFDSQYELAGANNDWAYRFSARER